MSMKSAACVKIQGTNFTSLFYIPTCNCGGSSVTLKLENALDAPSENHLNSMNCICWLQLSTFPERSDCTDGI